MKWRARGAVFLLIGVAGVLRDEQEGVVKVMFVAGRDGYEGTTRNGVTSITSAAR